MKLEYASLPAGIKKKIDAIQKHRESVNEYLVGAGLSISLAVSPVIHISENKLLAAGVFAGSLSVTMPLPVRSLLKFHDAEFRQEYLSLFRVLKRNTGNEKLSALLARYPYVVVDAKGNLVGKKTAPQLRRLPLGRRKVASPNAGKNLADRWGKKLLPKRKRK
ncbi:MAG: hypothetical protein CL944_01235 [Candidatus Diapherotrites archaeon]|uniref:Uncharacterized protein n=1 Tax=Candidatus Iainarchaeum sp. TaxID=3101447 RepID=A0A2D6LPG0_9ARCH|nr:hypothetical protein [Candidatus Diapherotrites archaeon]|tara:strand:+ start:1504 stop:1992 length:489 start_codon:yes stop_codon:yes gene_type:complete